jgi:WD40 repeat protein
MSVDDIALTCSFQALFRILQSVHLFLIAEFCHMIHASYLLVSCTVFCCWDFHYVPFYPNSSSCCFLVSLLKDVLSSCAVYYSDFMVKIVDTLTNKQEVLTGHEAPVLSVSLDPNELFIVSILSRYIMMLQL